MQVAGIGAEDVRTPVLRVPELDAIAGRELWLKAENLQHIGAFKARGALYAVGRLSAEERARGIITYSSGNHAQAVALAAARHGLRASVCMPEDAPEVKVEAVRRLGATILFAGRSSKDRHEAALALQAETGGVIIEPFDHPHTIAGQGTATLELLAQVEAMGGALDALVVPVGGGGLIAGACLVAAEATLPVYSAEPELADAMAKSLEAGERVMVPAADTIADGLKPVRVGALNFAIAKDCLSGSLRLSEEALGRALASCVAYAKVVGEPSGAAALAAALEGALPATAKRVGVILSGGNVSTARLADLLARHPPHAVPPPG